MSERYKRIAATGTSVQRDLVSNEAGREEDILIYYL